MHRRGRHSAIVWEEAREASRKKKKKGEPLGEITKGGKIERDAIIYPATSSLEMRQ